MSYYLEPNLSHKLKIAVVGLTNSGKSTLLNSIVGKQVASTARKPDHTKEFSSVAEYKASEGITFELFDTPGYGNKAVKDLPEFIANLVDYDLIIFVVNGINGIRKADREFLEQISKAFDKFTTFALLQELGEAQGALAPPIIPVMTHKDKMNAQQQNDAKRQLKELINSYPNLLVHDPILLNAKSKEEVAEKLMRRVLLVLPKVEPLIGFLKNRKNLIRKYAEIVDAREKFYESAWKAIISAAALATILGGNPIWGFAVLIPIIVSLIIGIAALGGFYEIDKQTAKRIAWVLFGGLSLRIIIRILGSSIPFLGNVLNAILVLACGIVILRYVESGMRAREEELRRAMNSKTLWTQAKLAYEKHKREIK